MDFGRISAYETVNYSLPPDHVGVKKVLGGISVGTPHVFTGGVLWADETFKGSIYPEKAKAKDYVKYYTQQFNTIELNLTHYRMPEAETIKRWQTVAPSGFRFCPKVHKDISHSTSLLTTIPYHNECNVLLNGLGEKLGIQFMQLPPHFTPHRLNELLDFFDKSDQRNMAIELRHPLWFQDSKEMNLLCNYLYKNKITLVLTDTPGRRDVLHMRLTTKTAFIRFNANNNHDTDRVRLNDWIQRLKHWFSSGLETVYFFIHTPTQLYMPHLVTYFIKQLHKECGVKLNAPLIRSEEKPEKDLFDLEN